jgi:valyl-tRNA synthetase
VQEVELVVPLKGLIDVAGELEKLAREQAKLEKELERIVGKLNNEKFMSNAPRRWWPRSGTRRRRSAPV